jgi:hypothetical protein
MRDSLFPPPQFSIAKDAATAPAARRVHEICNTAVWRSLGFVDRLSAVLLAATWPVTAVAISLPWLRRNAKAVAAMTGRSAIRQFREMVALAVRHRIQPRYYYMFEFYLDGRLEQAGDYMMRYETKQIAYRMLYPKVLTTGLPIKNKIAFAGYCRDHGLAALPLVAAFDQGARIADLGDGTLPEGDMFVKRVFGKGGVGAERWNWIGNGVYRSTQGPELAGPALLEHVAALSQKKGPYLVQPAVVNHTDLRDLSVGALSTVRIMTCRSDRGGHEVTNAALRMSINPKSAVDNFHAGGIAAAVDLKTGALGPASDLGLGPKFVWHDTHPLTGGQITGRVLPHWQEAMDLAVRAHAAFSEWAVIGWDVGILDGGPKLIEGNKGPDVDIMQRTLRGPIGNGRFGELLAYNLEQVRR